MDPKNYFEQRIKENEGILNKLKAASLVLSMSRLGLFLLTVMMIYLFLDNSVVVAISAVVGFGGFLFLVSRYTDLKNRRKFHQALHQINEAELRGLEGDYSAFIAGDEYLNGEHPFNQDIDLFGESSLFQRINRTGTLAGKDRLAEILNENDIQDIVQKQQAVQELVTDSNWRQEYQLTAGLIENEVDTEKVVNWMRSYKPVISKLFAYFPMIFLFISLTILVLYGFGVIPGSFVLYNFISGLAISGSYVKKINKLYNDAGKMKDTFMQYSKLLGMIEQREFSSAKLNQIKEKLKTTGKPASEVLGDLSKEINNLDQRNNIFFALLANGFLLWDLRYAYRVEKWMKDNEAIIADWFEVVAEFDAHNSLANFAFIHNHYIYPELTEDSYVSATGLGHPLLDSSKRIDNDLKIKEGNFFIITGANMAGKSTFLRTVALNLVMANCGLPVCAKSYAYKPVKLISSMRTTDSLKDDESYFFSELKRLKFIVDQLERDTYFIILDEILKGTNSKDKAEGSQKFVERLVATKSTGLIATHDLSLCTIADQSNEVENHYFDAQIVDDELYFDYKFKEGICQNMNASFLLSKMGIVQ